MIYKCQNCGLEYNQRIDYCDCGNNKFISIDEEINDTNSVFSYTESFPEPQNYEMCNEYKVKNEFFIKKTMIVISLIILFTVLLSTFVLFKAISYKSQNSTQETPVEISIENIPPIDSYWEDLFMDKAGNSVNKNSETIAKNENKPVQNSQIHFNETKINKNMQNNEITKVKIINEPQNTTENTNSVVGKREESIIQNEVKMNLDKKDDINQKSIIIQNSNPEEDNTNSVELEDFKVSLRQNLFNNLPILNIKGSGIALISFSISQDGKLINRNFVKMSGNRSLDDAVYYMLMKTPYVQIPPKSYKGAEFVMKLYFEQGRYEFSYE